MTRPTPQPGDIWRHWQGKKYKILSVDDGRVQYESFVDAGQSYFPFVTSSDRLDYFLSALRAGKVNRFEFVAAEVDRV